MALTNRIIANVYGYNGNPVDKAGGTANGRIEYIANYATTAFFTLGPPAVTYNGVTCNSRIVLYPSGLNQPNITFDCVETIATLVSNGS